MTDQNNRALAVYERQEEPGSGPECPNCLDGHLHWDKFNRVWYCHCGYERGEIGDE